MRETFEPETIKGWEGRTVAGNFPLQNYLGGSDHSAVYLTLRQGEAGDSEKAAIKLIPADAADAQKQLLRWQAARKLSHPNLIRLFEAGNCDLDGTSLLYVVEECAEENLSQILPERALTCEETRGMLPPLLRALQYVHDQGFVHGRIQPSNILAIGDQVKLSSDALVVAGDRGPDARTASAYDPPESAMGAASTAADVWRLGITLIGALTQDLPEWDRARPSAPQVPASVPEPFREIAAHCLQVDAAKRWTIAEIAARLESDLPEAAQTVPTSPQTVESATAPAISTQQKTSAKWPYLLGLTAVVAVVVFFLMARPRPSSHPAEVQPTQSQPSAVAAKPQPAPAPMQPEPKPSSPMPGASKAETTVPEAGHRENAPANIDSTSDDTTSNDNNNHNESGVVQRVMPQVSPGACRTIQGKVKVRVKVEVDAAGNVTKAEFESAGPSKYFSRLALEAARGWKFSPARSGAREWKLQFAFSRARTEVSAVRAKR